jgi:ribose transport system permease protein
MTAPEVSSDLMRQASPVLEPGHSALRRFFERPEAIVTCLLAVLIFGLAVAKPDLFATRENFRILLLGAALLLVVAVGQTFVIISAGIDLSVGAVLVLASVVAARVMAAVGVQSGASPFAGLIVALAIGALCGLANGILIGVLRLSAIIVTLATSSVALGFSYIITNGSDLRTVPVSLNDALIGSGLLGLPLLVWMSAAVCLIAALALEFTGFGRHTYAVGSDLEAARRAGIRVDRHIILIYGASGLLAGLAALMSVGRYTTTSLAGYGTISLQVITAVALGGASLFGGRGTVVGTVIGVFIPVVLQNGLIILGVQSYWQQVVTGVVLLAAIALDKFRRASQQRA